MVTFADPSLLSGLQLCLHIDSRSHVRTTLGEKVAGLTIDTGSAEVRDVHDTATCSYLVQPLAFAGRKEERGEGGVWVVRFLVLCWPQPLLVALAKTQERLSQGGEYAWTPLNSLASSLGWVSAASTRAD